MADLEDLKRKRDQLTAKIQQAEARQKATAKKAEDRIKVLVGAAVLHQQTQSTEKRAVLLSLLDSFLTRPAERLAVLGEDGKGSEAFKRLVAGGGE
nr:mobilization protein C [Pseudomonas sp.]QBM91775.1 mobilization protein C [Pseudomonas sp.]